jgi:hypothetical protein
VILPANGIAIVTILLVLSPPAMFNVMVVGARTAVDIKTPYVEVSK